MDKDVKHAHLIKKKPSTGTIQTHSPCPECTLANLIHIITFFVINWACRTKPANRFFQPLRKFFTPFVEFPTPYDNYLLLLLLLVLAIIGQLNTQKLITFLNNEEQITSLRNKARACEKADIHRIIIVWFCSPLKIVDPKMSL